MSSKSVERINEMGIYSFLLLFGATAISAVLIGSLLVVGLFHGICYMFPIGVQTLQDFNSWLFDTSEASVIAFYGLLAADMSLVIQAKYKIWIFEDLKTNSDDNN